jgi:hypothetical protein
MAESLSQVGEAAQDIASHVLQAAIYTEGGEICIAISTSSVVVKELFNAASHLTKKLSGTVVTLGAIYGFYEFAKPAIDAAIDKVVGGGKRDEQEVQDIRPGPLHLRRRFTDERFLEVWEEYESGEIKECLQKELSLVGIEVEGLKVEIENMEEVEEIKIAIKRRYRKQYSCLLYRMQN